MRWAECVVWRGKGNVAARFVHRGVCGQRLCRAEEECLYQIARALGISEETFRREEAAALEEHNRRMKLVRSSTGLIASVVVIGIFVLGHLPESRLVWPDPRLFFQPLQQRYQSSFLENGLMARLIDLAKLVFVRPFVWIMGKVSGLFRKTPAEPEVPSAAMPSCNRQSVGHAMPPCSRCRCPGVDFGWGGVADVEREAQKIDTDKARTQMAAVAGKAGSLPLVGKKPRNYRPP